MIFDLTGKTIGSWKVRGRTFGTDRPYWDCVCVCGHVASVRSKGKELSSKSCGCVRPKKYKKYAPPPMHLRRN